MAHAKAGRYAEVRAAVFPMSVHSSRVHDHELLEMARLTGEDAGPDVYIRQQVAVIARKDSRPFLAQITVPTLVLSGDQDQIISNELSNEMAAMIPGAKLVIVPDCGHLAPAEQPELVGAALDHWLRS
jgi:pimeloyl-ACP methyl ester carboxylesterase